MFEFSNEETSESGAASRWEARPRVQGNPPVGREVPRRATTRQATDAGPRRAGRFQSGFSATTPHNWAAQHGTTKAHQIHSPGRPRRRRLPFAPGAFPPSIPANCSPDMTHPLLFRMERVRWSSPWLRGSSGGLDTKGGREAIGDRGEGSTERNAAGRGAEKKNPAPGLVG